jgi:hypothetical protein
VRSDVLTVSERLSPAWVVLRMMVWMGRVELRLLRLAVLELVLDLMVILMVLGVLVMGLVRKVPLYVMALPWYMNVQLVSASQSSHVKVKLVLSLHLRYWMNDLNFQIEPPYYTTIYTFIMPRITPRTLPVSGYQHFITPLRRMIFDYDPLSPSQHGVRSYLRRPLLAMAQANPDVEVLVRKLRRGKAAVLRGHYGELLDPVTSIANW